MCYEERFFRRLVTKKAQKLEETKPVIERAPPTAQPIRLKPAPEAKRPKEVETELETA